MRRVNGSQYSAADDTAGSFHQPGTRAEPAIRAKPGQEPDNTQ
jgi:hypothetical protein